MAAGTVRVAKIRAARLKTRPKAPLEIIEVFIS
jgi:hypothetical protein